MLELRPSTQKTFGIEETTQLLIWISSKTKRQSTRIKVLTRRITIHLSEVPKGKGCSPVHLQKRQFIGQDLSGLELCFETQQEFNAHTLHHFKWKSTMCSIYIAYYRFLVEFPMFGYSGLSWTRIRNDCVKWRRWLDSDAALMLPTSDYSSSKALYQHIAKRLKNLNRLPLVPWTHSNLMKRQLLTLTTIKWLSLPVWQN